MGSSPCERGLSILFTHVLNRNQQCNTNAKKANAILGCITEILFPRSGCSIVLCPSQTQFTIHLSSSGHWSSKKVMTN